MAAEKAFFRKSFLFSAIIPKLSDKELNQSKDSSNAQNKEVHTMHYKTFPKTMMGTTQPIWEEVVLTPKEEFVEEQKARRDYLNVLKICIDDARKIMEEKGMPEYQADIMNIALTLFRKRASHVVYWKDSRCKEKFEFLSRGGYSSLKKKSETPKEITDTTPELQEKKEKIIKSKKR